MSACASVRVGRRIIRLGFEPERGRGNGLATPPAWARTARPVELRETGGFGMTVAQPRKSPGAEAGAFSWLAPGDAVRTPPTWSRSLSVPRWSAASGGNGSYGRPACWLADRPLTQKLSSIRHVCGHVCTPIVDIPRSRLATVTDPSAERDETVWLP